MAGRPDGDAAGTGGSTAPPPAAPGRDATPRAPRAEYDVRLSRWAPLADELERREKRLSNGRLLVFLAGIPYLIWVSKAWPQGWPTLLVPAVAFTVLVVLHGRARGARVRAERAARLYQTALRRLDDDCAGRGPTGEAHDVPGHLYAHDLDVLGTGSLFQLLCTCRTHLGEKVLAEWLLSPADADEARARQASVRELVPDVDLRESLALLGDEVDEVDAGSRRQDLIDWARARPEDVTPVERLLAGVLGVLGLAAVAAWALGVGVWPVGLVVLVDAAFALWMRRRLDGLFAHLEEVGDQLAVLSQVLVLLESRDFRSPKLVALRAALDTRLGAPSVAVARLDKLVSDFRNARYNSVGVVINLLLQLQVHRAHRLAGWRRAIGPSLANWMDGAGAFEALVALATYAYEHPDDAFPEIVDDGPRVEARELGHPLLPAARCVRNEVALGGELRLILISGSNMSGKSTLLRSVGVAVVMALAGAPVRARSLVVSPLAVGASIQIQDSLLEGASHFYAEITRLRDIDALTRGALPTLFLLDEILHGTNSTARLKGAEAVVDKLVERGAIGLVTTHDLALARMADDLGPAARNAHFEDQHVDGRMSFDYRMREGVVERGNALELMRSLGLEV